MGLAPVEWPKLAGLSLVLIGGGLGASALGVTGQDVLGVGDGGFDIVRWESQG